MTLEHIAIIMSDPIAAAAWYVEQLGFTIVRASHEPPYAHFLKAPGSDALIEIFNNPEAPIPDYPNMHPSVLHIAFRADDVAAERERLIAAGATPIGEIVVTDSGDQFAMVRDPWGVPVQLLKRAERLARQG